MYRLKKTVLNIFLLGLIIGCTAQEKDTVYVIFGENEQTECEVSMYRDFSDKQKIKSTYQKKGLLGGKYLRFEMCKQSFVCNSKDDVYDNFDLENQRSITKITINDMLKKWEQTGSYSRAKLYKNIYFVEKGKDGKYTRYKVHWSTEHFEN